MPGTMRKYMGGILAAFLLCGLLHVLLYGKPLFTGIVPHLCGVLILIWAASIRIRVTDRRLKGLLQLIALFLLAYQILQEIRFNLSEALAGPGGLLLYLRYLIMGVLPYLCLILALLVHEPEQYHLPLPVILLGAAVLLMAAGIMTNDLHHAFKYLPERRGERNGWLFYFFYAAVVGIDGAALFLFGQKSRLYRRQRYRWLPILPLAFGILYGVLYPFRIGPRLFGFRVWNIGEVLSFGIVSALEACIQAGMIPANTDYEKLFSLAEFPAVILDRKGEVRYRTRGAVYPFPEEKDKKLLAHSIPGGEIRWTEEIGHLQALNRELSETAQSIRARNSYLSEEARIKGERAELETRNRIYDRITRIVRPQMTRITELLDREEGSFEERLKKISVLCAYIKRRSNMELQADGGELSGEELGLAVAESMDYLCLSGVSAASACRASYSYPAGMLISAYEQVERVIEEELESLQSLMVFVTGEYRGITIRMMLKTGSGEMPSCPLFPEGEGFSGSAEISGGEGDYLLVLRLKGGGEPI